MKVTETDTVRHGQNGEISIGDLTILPKSWKAYKGKAEIKFPNREFALLLFLAENPNIVFPKNSFSKRFGALIMWGTVPP